MRTTRSLPYRVSLSGVSLTETPLDRDPPDRDPPLVNRITDRCKNITFPQLRLRAVITLGPVYNEFAYNEQFLCVILLVVSGTQYVSDFDGNFEACKYSTTCSCFELKLILNFLV